MASPSPSLTRVALLFVLLSSALSFSAHSASRRDAPAPAVDCSSLVLTMADCLSFVSNGSTVDKPEGTCCSGLKTVLKTDAECLCEAFRSSAQLGVVLNVTKAVTLPAACKVSAASAAKCALSIAPAAAPAEGQTSTPTSIATAPTAAEVASEVAPAPAPGKDSSASSRVSVPAALAFAVAAVAGPWFLI
ncbi:hypothetical protein MLD38_013677 [Melastoma candidum]|uniref:Uncharacterized protein n=1 Tax=Melastoma candidum TaxID=119954 RepID=A0ACB9RBM4_9MYRT|nr:hypothetical protein MLD38_013677 [Melastoma candidum]